MALPFLGPVIQAAVDGFISIREGEQQVTLRRDEIALAKERLAKEFELRLLQEVSKPGTAFRDFMLQYEGAGDRQPRVVQVLRSSVRPAITYWAVVLITIVMLGWVEGATLQANLAAVPEPLWDIFLAVFGFWFGGRAIMQGIETWRAPDKVQAEQAALTERESARARVAVAQARARAAAQRGAARESARNAWDGDDLGGV